MNCKTVLTFLLFAIVAALLPVTESRRFEKGVLTGFLLGNAGNQLGPGGLGTNLLPAAALACLRK